MEDFSLFIKQLLYCVKCRKNRESNNPKDVKKTPERIMLL